MKCRREVKQQAGLYPVMSWIDLELKRKSLRTLEVEGPPSPKKRNKGFHLQLDTDGLFLLKVRRVPNQLR